MITILMIADLDSPESKGIRIQLAQQGFAVHAFSNAQAALTRHFDDSPQALIIDCDLPKIGEASVAELLSKRAEYRGLPCIALTSISFETTTHDCRSLAARFIRKEGDIAPVVMSCLNTIFRLDDNQGEFMSEHETLNDSDGYLCATSEICDRVFEMLGISDDEQSFFEPSNPPSGLKNEPWVLSIEDDDDFADTLAIRLNQLGLKLVRASAGREGYRRAFMDAPRAILLDYELPNGNGDYVLRRLKESPATRHIPVIILTGRREKHIERQMRSLGAEDFLTKPLNWPQLQAALRTVMEPA